MDLVDLRSEKNVSKKEWGLNWALKATKRE